MKKISIAFFSLFFVLVANLANAQGAKVGYTSADAILSALPEAKTIEAEMKAYQAQIGKEFESKQKELQEKYEKYLKEAQTLAPVVREQREKEIQSLQNNMQEFEQKAQRDIQQKQQTLLAPVYDKIQNAIDEVAKADGYDYILSSDASGFPIILFAKEDHNITNKVITKLGGTPISNEASKTTTTPPAGNKK